MTQESKNFFQKYWQAIAIAVSINIFVGIATNIGAYKVVLYRLEENIRQDENQSQSIFELQINQITIANKQNIDLPNKFTSVSRGGKK